jgi:hypothetical protein
MPALTVLARSALCSGAVAALFLTPASAFAQILETDPNFRHLAGPATWVNMDFFGTVQPPNIRDRNRLKRLPFYDPGSRFAWPG